MSGTGRGRGWLSLKNSQNVPVVGASSLVNEESLCDGKSAAAAEQQFLMDKQFVDPPVQSWDSTEIVNRLKHLNVNDDGILFNQKIRHLFEYFKGECKNTEEFLQCFEALYQASLHNSELVGKLILLMTSTTVMRNGETIHDTKLKFLFLKKLQADFERAEELQKSDPKVFRNLVYMIGEYLHKGTQILEFAVEPIIAALVTCLEMLLSTHDTEDLKLFSIQLYLNSTALSLSIVSPLIFKVRNLLAFDKNLNERARLWLLLAIDISASKPKCLAAELVMYYQDQLQDKDFTNLISRFGMLTIQTVTANKALDSYKSNVSVLQVSDTSASHVNDKSVIPSIPSPDISATHPGSGYTIEKVTQNSSGWDQSNNQTQSKVEKAGRPILGAGARLQRNQNDDVLNTQNQRNQSKPAPTGISSRLKKYQT